MEASLLAKARGLKVGQIKRLKEEGIDLFNLQESIDNGSSMFEVFSTIAGFFLEEEVLDELEFSDLDEFVAVVLEMSIKKRKKQIKNLSGSGSRT